MPLTERTPPAILPGEADECSFQYQRAERQCLRKGPVDRAVLRQVIPPVFEQPKDLWVYLETFGNLGDVFGDFLQSRTGNRRQGGAVRILEIQPFPDAAELFESFARGPPFTAFCSSLSLA